MFWASEESLVINLDQYLIIHLRDPLCIVGYFGLLLVLFISPALCTLRSQDTKGEI